MHDYLSIVAILISLTSLFLGYRNTAFQRRAKNIEARSTVIGKMFDVKREIAKVPIKIEKIRSGIGNKVDAERLQKLVEAKKHLRKL